RGDGDRKGRSWRRRMPYYRFHLLQRSREADVRLRFLLIAAGVGVCGVVLGQQPAGSAKTHATTTSMGPAAAQGDWPMYGHDFSSQRYSPLAQINTENVGKLKQSWVYHL